MTARLVSQRSPEIGTEYADSSGRHEIVEQATASGRRASARRRGGRSTRVPSCLSIHGHGGRCINHCLPFNVSHVLEMLARMRHEDDQLIVTRNSRQEVVSGEWEQARAHRSRSRSHQRGRCPQRDRRATLET
eukprot:scaffold149527_cov30-Tisochrysis_lutea.AAC.5